MFSTLSSMISSGYYCNIHLEICVCAYMNRIKKEEGKLKIQIKMNFVIPFKILILCLISNPSNLGLHILLPISFLKVLYKILLFRLMQHDKGFSVLFVKYDKNGQIIPNGISTLE